MDTPLAPPDGDLLTAHPANDDGTGDPILRPSTPFRQAGHPDGIVTGLCALIAQRLGLDALWIRLGFVVLGLLSGLGILVYVGLWLALVVAADARREWARVLGGAVLIGGIPLVISQNELDFASGPLAVVALLAGLALALWQPRTESSQSAGVSIVDHRRSAPVTTEVPTPSEIPLPTPRVRRPPSILGRLALGVAVIVAAGGALIDQMNGGRLHPEQWLGAAALVCGLGLVLGAFRGNARWLIVPAALLAIAGYGGGLLARAGIDLDDATGDRWVNVYAESPAQMTSAVGFGSTHISIDQVPDQQVTIDANMAAGTMWIWFADDVAVEVRPDVDDVKIRYDGRTVSGEQLSFGPDREPDVIINASLVQGTIKVSAYPEFDPQFIDQPFPAQPVVTTIVDDGQVILPDGSQAFGPLTQIDHDVAMTQRGWLVLGDREAVVTDTNDIVLGQGYVADESVLVVETSFGEYRIVGSILITPAGAVYDLEAIRALPRTEPSLATVVPEPIPAPPLGE